MEKTVLMPSIKLMKSWRKNKMNLLKEKIEAHQFVVTVELDPPKSASPAKTESEIIKIAHYIDAVNVADCPMAKLRMSPIALASIIQRKYKVESIFHLTCHDRNVIGLQAELLGAAALGVHNILTLTGDAPSIGDHPAAKGVFEVDSSGLVEIAHTLTLGYDMAGNQLEVPADFYIGTTANPDAPDIDQELKRLEKKKKAGAQFAQTQPIYEINRAEEFLKGTKEIGLPVLFGIVPLKSAKMARYFNTNVPGVHVPDSIVNAMEYGGRETGLRIAKDTITALKELQSDGAHLMPVNDIDAALYILQ